MTSEQRKAIETKIGRTLTAEEIGRGSITRAESSMTWEQEKADRRAKIAAANAKHQPHQPRWMESTLEASETLANPPRHKYPDGRARETSKEFRKRMHADRQERTADAQTASEHAANLATDPVYGRMNRIAANTVEKMRWDSSYPESAWGRALEMQQAAKADDRETFHALNKEHIEYLDGITNEKQVAIDNEIKQLQAMKQTFNEDRYDEPPPAADQSTCAHIRRASGMMQYINNQDGHIEEYDPRIPQAKELALEKLAQHQADTAGKYGEPIPVQL